MICRCFSRRLRNNSFIILDDVGPFIRIDPTAMALTTCPPRHIDTFHPQSFRDRGAVVPFTTPLLGGARVRLGARQQIELIICNPAGRRGVYVLPLATLETFCQPSLFDRALIAAIIGVGLLSPAALRKAARDTMTGGLAGRAAQRGAIQAAPSAQALQGQTRAALRQTLHDQIGGVDCSNSISRLATQLRLPNDIVDAALLALADLFAEIGISVAGPSPVAAHRARLDTLDQHVQAALPWLEGRGARDVGDLHASLGQFAACGKILDADIAAVLADAPTMIGDFTRDPLLVADRLTRVDWLFDGWDRIAALWRDDTRTGPLPSRTTLAEILPQVPALPTEALAWIGITAQAMPDPKPGSPALDDQRMAVSLGDLLARNERVIAALV